jgi:hypothetical protein
MVESVTYDLKDGEPHTLTKDATAPYFECLDIQSHSLKSVSIGTDGLMSYSDQDRKEVATKLMVPQFLDFPSTNGVFVKRNMNFLKREMLKRDWVHTDDIAIGTICLE